MPWARAFPPCPPADRRPAPPLRAPAPAPVRGCAPDPARPEADRAAPAGACRGVPGPFRSPTTRHDERRDGAQRIRLRAERTQGAQRPRDRPVGPAAGPLDPEQQGKGRLARLQVLAGGLPETFRAAFLIEDIID